VSTRAGSPPPPGLGGPLTVIGIIATGAGLLATTWVAARISAGGGHPVPALGAPLLRALLDGGLLALLGAGGSPVVFWVVLGLLLLAMAGVLGAVGFGVSRALGYSSTRPATAMASRRELGDLTGKAALTRARHLRPTLDNHERVTGGELGLRLGRLPGLRGGHDVLASHEDVVLEICGPRSNKTSALVVPAILGAPGPVITTSNKIDAYTLTVHGRTQAGRVFVLDPQGIARAEQTWWWNPLRAVTDMASAAQVATHFIATVGGGSDRADPYFTPASSRLLAQHILAAAAAPGHSLRDVRAWLARRAEEPADLLEAAGLAEVATSLRATMEAPPEQRGGLYETALTALGPLEVEAIARYVTPPSTWQGAPRPARGLTELDPWQFFAGYATSPDAVPRDTLYLLTKEGAGTAAPVVAALVDRLLKTAAEIAAARGGRCEPPPRIVLDEAANICPIKDLPDLYSYFGSMSLQVITILQSYQQGVAVWGQSGMHKLWSAATIKLIGAGVHDAEFCEQVSRLIGEHDIPHDTTQSGRGGGSISRGTRRERIMTAADVAALPKTHAVLIASGRRPALLELLPWYTEPDADELARHAATATDQVRRAAATALGPDNPIGHALHRELTHPPRETT
jgi:type IV secretion system protein VirD4